MGPLTRPRGDGCVLRKGSLKPQRQKNLCSTTTMCTSKCSAQHAGQFEICNVEVGKISGALVPGFQPPNRNTHPSHPTPNPLAPPLLQGVGMGCPPPPPPDTQVGGATAQRHTACTWPLEKQSSFPACLLVQNLLLTHLSPSPLHSPSPLARPCACGSWAPKLM